MKRVLVIDDADTCEVIKLTLEYHQLRFIACQMNPLFLNALKNLNQIS
jgi:hypothetical protein